MNRQAHNPAPNVYTVAQRDFRAIPGAPWVYWIPEGIRRLFRELPKLGEVAQPRQGLATADNFRFLRFWWEVGLARIAFGCRDREEARATGRRWFPYMKGGAYRKWYGNQEYVVNWWNDGVEIKEYIVLRYPYLNGKWEWVVKNTDYYFREGVTFSDLTSGALSIRFMPPGFVFDHAGNCLFPEQRYLWEMLGLLNSKFFSHLMHINPTIHFYIGDFIRMPVPPGALSSLELAAHAQTCSRLQMWASMLTEPTFDFIAPPRWDTGPEDLAAARARLQDLEAQIDEEVYRLYGIAAEDRATIEAELAGASNTEDHATRNTHHLSRTDLAAQWASYALGIVLGRFHPGLPRERDPHKRGPLGRAVFHPEDFAVGSLPAPDEDEFLALVAPGGRPAGRGGRAAARPYFAYVDAEGGRHLFPAQVEARLRELAIPDGVGVVSPGHPRDVVGRVREALTLMWGDDGLEAITQALGGDLARFLERDFWPKYHMKWYRRRPVYWLLQSPQRALTIYLHHEAITPDTLYLVQTEIVKPMQQLLAQRGKSVREELERAEGAARRRLNKDLDKLIDEILDMSEFERRLKRVLELGYAPDPDDGVLINMAPLHELIPWPAKKRYQGRRMSELEMTWLRLQAGDFDWAKMAMRYWPERVREKAKQDRSLAIAHGLA